MPYFYEISFDIPGSDFGELKIGESVQTALAYLRALLPNEPGYITSYAMYSLSHEELTHVILVSHWETWDSLLHHRTQSRLNEGELIKNFQLKVELLNLKTHVYEEVT